LKSPIYTIEEKYAYVEKYLCGLQISFEKSYCSHDTIKNGTSNYFERGKHANDFHNKLNDPLYLPKISKMHDSNSHFINFLLVIATIMKEEVMSALYMTLIIISCIYLL
jgi:hypothetical protein